MPIHGLALAAGRPCAYLTSESGARADRSGAARSYLAVHHRHPASRHVSDLCSWPPGRKSVRGIPCLSDQAGWAARASGGQAVRAFAASFWAGEVLVDSGTVGMGPSCLVAASRTAAGFQPVRSISADRPARLARCCRPPGIADRLRASRLKKWRTATRPLPGPDPRGHRAPCGQGPLQRVDGPGDGPASGHGAPMAVSVRRARHARAGRPQAHRSPAVVHRAAGRAGQDAGVSASRRNRVPLSQWSCPGAGTRGRAARRRRGGVLLHRALLAVPGRAQALAVPLLDLHH